MGDIRMVPRCQDRGNESGRPTESRGPGAGIPGATYPLEFDDRLERCLSTVVALDPTSVLDVGCGDGFFLSELRRRLPQPTTFCGLEANAEAARRAQERGFDCREGLADAGLPFPSAMFDVVFAGEIIEHVADTDGMLEELHRVLRPGGHLLLTTPNLLAWYNRLLCLAGVTPMYVEHSYRASYGPSWSLCGRVTSAVGHLRIFTYTTLAMVLRQDEFEVLWIRGAARLPVRLLWPLDRLVARVRPRMAAQLMALAVRGERPADSLGSSSGRSGAGS